MGRRTSEPDGQAVTGSSAPISEPLILHRDLDLRQLAGIEELLKVISSQPGSVMYQPEEIEKGLTTLAKHFPDADWLEISRHLGGSLLIPTGRKRTSMLSLGSAVRLGLQLSHLRDCEGFGQFLRGFTNPTQFFDSMFEAEIADFCLSRPRCTAVQFAPEYDVGGHLRHPDFSLVTAAGLLVCECKSISEEARNYSATFARIHDALSTALEEAGGIAGTLRVEVHLQSALEMEVQEWAKEHASEAIRAAEEGLVGQVLKLRSCKLCVVERSASTVFDRFQLCRLSVTVGDAPVSLTPEYAFLRTTTDRLGRRRATSVGDLMRKAKSQLPEAQRCVVFIQATDSASAKLAAERRLGDKDYNHVIAFGIWSESGGQFVHRLGNKRLVGEAFGPFEEQRT